MSEIEILASGLRFPEGPAILEDGSVVFVEIAGGTIRRLFGDGTLTEVCKTGGGPNGLAVGPDGALYVCNHGGNRYDPGHYAAIGPAANYNGGYIQRVELDTGRCDIIYTHCGGRRLSAPNDLVFDKHGGFYFTDFGKRHATYRDHGGIYYASIDGRQIMEVAYPVAAPNGIGLSADGTVLYVAETDAARLWALDIVSPGVVKGQASPNPRSQRLICGLPGFQRFDSLALQMNGDVCVATLVTGQISVVSPEHGLVEQIKLPDEAPTNICFGGPDLCTAYITLAAQGALARMRWRSSGLPLNF